MILSKMKMLSINQQGICRRNVFLVMINDTPCNMFSIQRYYQHSNEIFYGLVFQKKKKGP